MNLMMSYKHFAKKETIAPVIAPLIAPPNIPAINPAIAPANIAAVTATTNTPAQILFTSPYGSHFV